MRVVPLVVAVVDDVDILDENQAAADHFVDDRQEHRDLLGAIDDFDALG